MNRKARHLLECLLLVVTATALTAQSPPHRVVIDVTAAGAEHWTGVLNNIENLRKALGPAGVEIESVSHGGGLEMLLKTNAELRPRLEQAAASGVVFAACQNTMRAKGIRKEDLFPFVTVVDSGVAEVVRKQEGGWSYLKVGP